MSEKKPWRIWLRYKGARYWMPASPGACWPGGLIARFKCWRTMREARGLMSDRHTEWKVSREEPEP